MKILYAIQGTGNGHISRARDIIPILQKKGDVDILVSGMQVDLQLPYLIKYKFKGLGFIFGKNGGVDLVETYKKSNLKRFYLEIKQLPVHEYDFVISDFEPVSAWACRRINKNCIGLSHQLAVANKKSPKPKKSDIIGKTILNIYAPVTAAYGFHFKEFDKNIFTPIIRNEIRTAIISSKSHFTVYLPSYDDNKLIKFFSQIKNVKWQIFSKHTSRCYQVNNISILPIHNEDFIKSFTSCAGILCGAGFETPSEAIFLQKKMLVIPMKGQYEQQCNAAALKEMDIPVIKSLKNKYIQKVKNWTIKKGDSINYQYPDITENLIDKIFKNEIDKKPQPPTLGNKPYSHSKLKRLTILKILKKASG